MTELTQMERAAALKALSLMGIDADRLDDEMNSGYLTINTGIDKNDYAYFYDGSRSVAVEVGYDRVVDDEDEIEKLFNEASEPDMIGYSEYVDRTQKNSEDLRKLMERIQKMDFLQKSANGKAPYLGAYVKSDNLFGSVTECTSEHKRPTSFDVKGVKIVREAEMVNVQMPDDPEVDEWNGQIEESMLDSWRPETIRELRDSIGMSQKAFAEMFAVPIRTLQNWEYDVHSVPEYILFAMERSIHDHH